MKPAQSLVVTGALMILLLALVFPPWYVERDNGPAPKSIPDERWIAFAPFWEPPYRFNFTSNTPFCPEQHVSFAMLGMEIAALGAVSVALFRRVGQFRSTDYESDYAQRRYQEEMARRRRL